MKPERIPGDGAQVAKNYLETVLPPLFDSTPTVGLNVPRDWTPGSAPHLAVFDDGGPTVWPIAIKSRIRITAWSDGRATSRAIVGRALGILLAHRIEGLAAVTDPTSIIEDKDPSNGGHMASATVAAQVRTIAVS